MILLTGEQTVYWLKENLHWNEYNQWLPLEFNSKFSLPPEVGARIFFAKELTADTYFGGESFIGIRESDIFPSCEFPELYQRLRNLPSGDSPSIDMYPGTIPEVADKDLLTCLLIVALQFFWGIAVADVSGHLRFLIDHESNCTFSFKERWKHEQFRKAFAAFDREHKLNYREF